MRKNGKDCCYISSCFIILRWILCLYVIIGCGFFLNSNSPSGYQCWANNNSKLFGSNTTVRIAYKTAYNGYEECYDALDSVTDNESDCVNVGHRWAILNGVCIGMAGYFLLASLTYTKRGFNVCCKVLIDLIGYAGLFAIWITAIVLYADHSGKVCHGAYYNEYIGNYTEYGLTDEFVT